MVVTQHLYGVHRYIIQVPTYALRIISATADEDGRLPGYSVSENIWILEHDAASRQSGRFVLEPLSETRDGIASRDNIHCTTDAFQQTLFVYAHVAKREAETGMYIP